MWLVERDRGLMSSGPREVTMAMADPMTMSNPRGGRLGSLGPATPTVVVADSVVVTKAWLAAVGAPLGRGMVLCRTLWAGVREVTMANPMTMSDP